MKQIIFLVISQGKFSKNGTALKRKRKTK